MSPKDIVKLAREMGWRGIMHDSNQGRLRFKRRKDDLIDVWYGTMTVATILTHPKKGRHQLFRKFVDYRLLKKIFRNPRLHTGEGYY